MKKTLWQVTARPIASCLATADEKEAIKDKSITVTMECTSMGRRNYDKLTNLAFDKCQLEFGYLCRIGGALISAPSKVKGGAA